VLCDLVEHRELKSLLAGAAHDYLALAAHQDRQSWAGALGVLDIASGVAVTKISVARAVTALRASGLVALEQLDPKYGRRRPGYQLHRSAGIQLRAYRKDHDGRPQYAGTDCCPDTADNDGCPRDADSTLVSL
jgi:hypothetical protein